MNAALQKIEMMPSDIQREVLDFAQFLMSKKQPENTEQSVKQRWAGALRDFKSNFTALELQQKANDWRA